MKVDRTPHNRIPEKWAFDPEVGPFMRALMDELTQLRDRTGGDFDQVEENAARPWPRPPMLQEPDPVEPPQPRREPDVEARIDVLGVAAARRAQEALDGVVPVGGIVAWSGTIANIPSGWAICDGTNGTPDLTDRFIIHADADSGGTRDVGDTGGAHSVTSGAPSATVDVQSGSGTTVANDTHTHTVATLPKFHALAFIQRIS